MIMNDLLTYAKEIGHEVFITTTFPKQDNYIDNADLTILCDVFNSPLSIKKMSRAFISYIIETDKYIHFDNAYVDSCNMDYLPCNGSASNFCEHKNQLSFIDRLRKRELSNKCFNNNSLVRKMYQNSISNIFLSPLHHSKVSAMLNIESKEYFILRPTVDTSIFFDKGEERDIKYIFAGAISEAKGVDNLKEFFKDSEDKILMVGKNIYGKKLEFADYTGFVDYSEMPKYFNRAQNFVYLPRWPEPQGRVVVEAALCGCNLITNENVGATSFPFDIGDPENLKNSEQEFWEYIQKLI
nr:putative glycosyltransferase [Vibrio metoecus]